MRLDFGKLMVSYQQDQMRKFEQQLKEKAHLNKIRNAKRTVQVAGKQGSKASSKRNGEEAQLLIKLFENKSYDSIPAYKLLRTAGLQQYTRGFIERGYGINLGKLGLLSEKEKNILYEDLKILPGHTVKLDKLISTLSKHSVDPSEYEESVYSASHMGKKSTCSIKNHDNTENMKTNRNSQTNRIELNLNYNQLPNPMSIGGFDDSDYEKQLARVLNEYTPEIGKDKKKQTYDMKMATRISHGEPKVTSVGPNRKISSGNNLVKLPSNSITGQDFKKKTPIVSSGKPTVKKSEVPKGTGMNKKLSSTTDSSKLMMKLIGSEQYSKCSTNGIIEMDLGIGKIKNLYRSFEGALMGSTIANIDIQELVFAFSGFVESKVLAAPEPTPITYQPNMKKVNERYEDSLENQNAQMEANQSIEDEVGNILRESYLHPLYRNEEIDEDIEAPEDELFESEGQEEEINENEFFEPENSEEKLQESSVSSFLGGESYQFGLAEPLKIFDEPDPSELDYFKPTIDSISNFIKNIVLAAKMERQISIMAAYYLETFISKSGIVLTSLNYKRLLVTVLLLASKIWDDESFESPSFSRTFPEYTTVLLNEMEKQVLNALEYKLKLDKKEYAGIFFKMRKFVRKNARSCQNKRFDLKKIRELQMGIKRDYKSNFGEKRNSF